MRRFQSPVALLCTLLTITSVAGAQVPQASISSVEITRPTGRFSSITRPYRPSEIGPINVANTNRLDALLKAGNLYLSLQDAIALALENNLDVETQRYGAVIAQTNLERAKSGGALRGVTPTVENGPSSAAAGSVNNNGVQGSASSVASSAGNNQGVLVQQTGSVIPNLDPAIQGILRFGHTSTPQTNVIVTGTTALVQSLDVGQLQLTQGFLTGTSYSFGYSDVKRQTNIYSDLFNPNRTGSLSLNVTQHLLQGFGISVNNRIIRQAKNNIESADLQFKQQLIATTTAIMNLYWDLVSFNDDVKAKQQSLAYNQKLYSDNKKQVEIGTMAPIEIVRAEAAVASSEQDLILSETRVLQQETIIKNYVSRNGVASPSVADAHIIPTDRIRIPDQEEVQPLQDLAAMALRARPDLSQRRIGIENNRINLKGSRSQLLPTLDAFASLSNNALAGSPNTLPIPPGIANLGGLLNGGNGRATNGYFLGGYSTLFSQLFRRNFPDYAIGLQLNVPLRNRAAQADYVLDQITVRQSELALVQAENQVRVEVQNAVIGLRQSRATYQAALKNRVLQEQTLDAEQKKLQLGASTIFQVILVQRDLATAQANEVAALSNYSKARVEMERSTGQTLANHNISISDAYNGKVATPPATLPQ